MPAQKQPVICLHRFRDCGSIAILNSTGSVYFDARAARTFSKALNRLARSLEKEAFRDSAYGSVTIPATQHAGA